MNLIRFYKEQKSKTEDMEWGQAIEIRLPICLILILYEFFPWSDKTNISSLAGHDFEIVPAYVVTTLLIAAHVLWNPQKNIPRRIIAIMRDIVGLSFYIGTTPFNAIIFVSLYLW